MVRRFRIPPMLADIIQATFSSCEGIRFDFHDAPCPHCRGDLSGYDMKKRLFAVVRDGDTKRSIHVMVKRFRCRKCGHVVSADQPFYPDTRIGSPVVDLCITLGATMHFPRVSATLADMGIVVDRWSVRNYVRNNSRTIPGVDMYGIHFPLSVFSLSALTVEAGEKNSIDAARLLAACNYPSRVQTPAATPPEHTVDDPADRN